MTPLEQARKIAQDHLNPAYGHGDVIEAIRRALMVANAEAESRRGEEDEEETLP